jgi:hypothetical protein
VHTSVDPEAIPDSAAADMLNVTIEDGRIAQRLGFSTLSSGGAPAGFSAGYGFEYVQGYNASNALIEEYLSVEKHSGTIRPYTRDVATGAPTQIGTGTITQPAYGAQPGIRAFAFNSNAYVISPSETGTPLFRHAIGDTTSWVPMSAAKAPSTAPKVVDYSEPTDAGTTIPTLLWDNGSSLSSGAVAFGGGGSSNLSLSGGVGSTGNGVLRFLHSLSGSMTAFDETVTVTLDATNGPGQQDWRYVDRIIVPVTSALVAKSTIQLDPKSILVTAVNAAGQSFQGVISHVFGRGIRGGTPENLQINIVVDFPVKVSRADWQHIQKIVLSWTVIYQLVPNPWWDTSSGATTQTFTVSPILLGQVDCTALDTGNVATDLMLGYTLYSSSSGLESGISPAATIHPAELNGQLFWDADTNTTVYYHARPKLYLKKDTGTGYDGFFDSYRIYAKRPDDTVWFRIDTISTANVGTGGSGLTISGTTYDSSYSYQLTWSEVLFLPSLSLGSNYWSGLVCGCPYKGGVVWGFKGGVSNLQFSAQGSPEILYNSADSAQLDIGNSARPANYDLADNGADDPVSIFPLGDALLILGSYGAYGMTGFTPSTMSPTYRLPTALGCLGQYAACLWHDEVGNPSVAFVSKNAEGVYLVQGDPSYFNSSHFKVTELTTKVRGLLKSFLLDGQGLSSWATLRMGVDETKQALYVVMGSRAMVLRRPSQVDGERHWELYDYGVTIGNLAFNTQRRLRWIRSTGVIDEVEWSSALAAPISGALADGGSAPTGGCHFTTKKFVGDNRRIDLVDVDRVSLTDTPSVSCASTRQTRSLTVASGKRHFRFGFKQTGWEHQFTITLPDGSSPVRRVVVDEIGPLGRRILG